MMYAELFARINSGEMYRSGFKANSDLYTDSPIQSKISGRRLVLYNLHMLSFRSGFSHRIATLNSTSCACRVYIVFQSELSVYTV